MFERDVTISLNADVSNYSSSLSQAIAITQQYSSAADTALGTVAKLNAGFVQGLIKVSSGLTGPQRMATDAAAAYQQQLSGLQATASVTGQNFGQLEKSTRSLARAFPIGMTQAVQQVQALQSAGVTSNKEIERLAVSFTKLGAANNSFGPELGQQMLQVTRAFGNSTTQIDALGDSLTTVSKQWGANASGVLTFSKAIAPIASTVGMSQTAVMGLSAAMSRLGDDGYMAANSFNKVLLDMNRSIRDGGPELKVYADLLNMTSDSLKNLFKSDPTEVLLRFTEAVSKAGPEAQKTLEALGLDGVRTTRSITALSRSGDLREIVNTSVSGYGDGSTAKAAEEAFSGVNDQMTRLTESMRQTVASAGKPFLGFMEDVLKAGNAVSEVTNKVMQNDTVQKLATLGIVGGVGGGLLIKGLAATSLGSMVLNLLRSGRDSSFAQDYRAGRDAARQGITPAQGSNMATRLGGFVGTAQGPPPAPGTAIPGIRDRVNETIRTATGAVGRVMDADRNSMATARGAAAPVPMSPAGAALRASMGDLVRDRDMAAVRAAGAASRNYMGSLAASGGIAGLAGRAGLYTVEAGRTAGAGLAAAGRGLARIGGSGLGQMALIGGAIAGGYALYQGGQERQAQLDNIETGTNSDIYATFNAFAEAAGQAGRGLVDFSAAVTQATNRLAQENSTYEEAGRLTSAEASQATAPGYTRAFNIVGNAARGGPEDIDALAQQALTVLGSDPQAADVARVVSDVANQTSVTTANAVGERLTEILESGEGGIDPTTLVKDVLANTGQGNFFGITSEESATLAQNLGKSMAQQSYEISQVYGDQAGAIENLSNAEEFFNAAKTEVGTTGRRGGFDDLGKREAAMNLSKVLQAQLGLTDEQMDYVFGPNAADRAQGFGEMSFDQVLTRLEDYSRETGVRPTILDTADEAKKRGISLSNPSYESFAEMTEVEKKAYDLQSSFEDVTGSSSTLSESLYGVNDAARSAGLTLEKLAKDSSAQGGLTQEQRLVLEAVTNKNEGTVNQAAEALARQAFDEARGNTVEAQARLRQETAVAQEGTAYQAVLQAAQKQLEVVSAPARAAMPETTIMLEQVQQGRVARRMGVQSDFGLEQNRQSEIAAGADAEAQFTGMARGFLMQKAQVDLQLQQARAQAGLQISQMRRDYGISVSRATEDYRTQEYRATRDFNIQMNRQEVDFQRDRRRATQDFRRQERWNQQDFNRQVRYATQDNNIAMARMERDYNKQVRRTKEDAAIAVERAERDYQKARSRAVRDFNTQMSRMEADYNLQKTRATDDYNKSVLRANEDYQRQRGRAQRDFAKQQAYAEADFNKSRTRAVEDYNKQLRRLVEDSAKSLYDPYKRIQAQMVMDGGQLVANLAAQNKALADQMGTLDKLRASGLSQQSIDVLGLGDAKNAQQAARLLADSMSDPTLIAQLNEQIAGRVDLTQMFVTSEDNTQTRRMAEDFALQMARMEEDYTTSSARANEQFQTAMADMAEDFSTQMTRAGEDFTTAMNRMAEDYATGVTRAREDQKQALADMAEDHAQALADAAADLARVLAQMGEDYASAVRDANEDFGRAMARMMEEYAISVARSREMFKTEMDRQDADFERMRRRAQRDFDRQMADAEKDFRKMLARMAQDFGNAISDIGASLALAEQAAFQSLIAYGQMVAKGEEEIFRDFGKFIASLPKDMQDNMGESMRDLLQYMAMKFPELYRKYFPNGLAGIVLGNSGGLPSPAERGEGASPVPGAPPAVGSGPGGPVPVIPPVGFSPVTEENRTAWYDQMEAAGKDAWQGWADGFAWANPANWVKEIFKVIVEAVKTFLWIKSPSRVFEGLGKNTIDGFVNGITDNVPTPQKIAKLFSDMFSSARTWLEDFPDNVKKWIGENTVFRKISDALPTLKALGDEIEDRFDGAKKFLEDLPGNALKWVGQTEIFKELKKAFPGIAETKDELVDRFSGVKDFLVDLPVNVGKWIVSQNKSILSGITSKFPDPVKLKQELIDVFTGKSSVGEWLSTLGTWINDKISMKGAFDKIPTAFKAALKGVVDLWNKLDIPIDFTFPDRLGVIPIPPPLGGARIRIDDIIPDVYNPFAVGGVVTAPVKGLVGEAGPEAIIPLNQRGAKIMADTLRQFIDDRVFDGALTNPYVINVEMADVNLDFTDSGSEFSQQARELLQRVKDAAKSTELFMQATGLKITEIVDESSDSLVKLAQAIEDAFGEAAEDVEEDTKSIKDAVVSMNDAIETDFLELTSALDTDLTDLTSSFSTAVDSIITETDRMIAEAIARLEDFASSNPGGGGGGGGDDGSDDGGDGGGEDGGGGDTSGAWQTFSSGYSRMDGPSKTIAQAIFGGQEPTESAFGALTSDQQSLLASSAADGLFDVNELGPLVDAFPVLGGGGGGGGGGTPPPRDLSFKNYDTLSKAVSQSDQDFLKAQFGGKAPTSSTWSRVTETQRDALIKALEDKDITSNEREAIKNLNLPNLGGGGGGGEPGDPGDGAQQSWDVFREGYRKLGESDKNLVKAVFGGQAPTYDLWLQLTPTQQRRLRDVVRDGEITKDERETVKDIDPYKIIGRQIVDYAEGFKGRPYKIPADPPSSFDCSTFTSYVYRKFGKSIASYSDTQFAGGRNVTGDEMPGDLVFFKTHPSKVTGHVGLYIGGGKMIDAPAPGDVVSVNTATSRGDYKGARRYFAEGGIVNRRQDAVIGEAGPEVVVPLNERGAEFFASAMARYAQPQDARQAMVSPYSTPVNVSITHTYDNRTMFTGPIEVAANNPDEFAAKAAAKQRRQRLSQPLGSSR